MKLRQLTGALIIGLLVSQAVQAEVLYRNERTDLPRASELVSLDADETPLSAALSLLAMQVGVNVIVAPGVEGTISIHLADVPFKEALGALTSGRSISFYTSGDVVVISPKSEGSKIGMGTLAFRLRHLRPESIFEAAKTLMSPDGEAVPLIQQGDGSSGGGEIGGGQDGAPPVIIFRDYEPYLLQLQDWLEAIDVPQHQVLIEVKFVEARADDVKNLGVEWVSGVGVGVGGASLGAAAGGTTSDGGTTDEQTGSFSYLNDLNTSEVQWGTAGVTKISAMINYLVETGKAKVESRPKVAVMDNEVATIHVTITNPVQTVNRFSEGAFVQDVVTWQYIETGLKLMVRPRVSDDGYVSLHVNPTFEEILAFVGPADAPAPVTARRSIETTVKVKSGETLVLGGLMRESDIVQVKKVWLLGDIPILGALFRSTRTQVQQDELLIVITPQILPPGHSAVTGAGP